MNEQKKDINDEHIKELIKKREYHRDNKEFDKSDLIRDELLEKGIKLIDKSNGITDWELIQNLTFNTATTTKIIASTIVPLNRSLSKPLLTLKELSA